MSKTKIADEYADIAARLAEIEREKTTAVNTEAPKAWPMYAHCDSQAPEETPDAWGFTCYLAPDSDLA